MKNFNVGFHGCMKQFDQIEGVLTAFKPDFHFHIDNPSLNDAVSVILPFQFSLKTLSGHYDKPA